MSPTSPGPGEGLNAAVAAALRAEKAAQSKTNDDLAALSGLTKGSVQRYLAADRHIDVATLDALARALNTTPTEIVEAAQERLARENGSTEATVLPFQPATPTPADEDEEIAAHDSIGTIEEEQEAPDTP